MAKKHKALTAVMVRNAGPGKYADGGGLYLRVDDDGRRGWVLRIVIKGKRREIGLGPVKTVSLAEARQEAARLRQIARKGRDPLAERRREREIMPTFEEAARKVHESLLPTFRNKKHGQQWINTLRDYAFPAFGSRPVDQIESADVLTALSPIWTEKPETARRVKQRMKTVFAWAKVSGFRAGDNPAEAVALALPKHATKKKHFTALPYAQVPAFLAALGESSSGFLPKIAFEYLILTAARTSEVLLARWNEIDLDAATWTVPAERMKAKVEHRVPLPGRCLEILTAARQVSGAGELVFPGRNPQRPLSGMVFEMILRRMGRNDITPHGFRSSFRDWAEERTSFKGSVIEAALAHTVRDKVEAAYRRGDLFDQRRRLMDAWAAFATAVLSAKVVRIADRA